MKRTRLLHIDLTLAAGHSPGWRYAAGSSTSGRTLKNPLASKRLAFEKQQYNVKVCSRRCLRPATGKNCASTPGGAGPDVLVIPNDQSAAVVGTTSPLSVVRRNRMPLRQPINASRKHALYGILKAVETWCHLQQGPDRQAAGNSLRAWLDYSKTQREQNKYGLLAKF